MRLLPAALCLCVVLLLVPALAQAAGATPKGLVCLATFDGNRVEWRGENETYRLYRMSEGAPSRLLFEGTNSSFVDHELVADVLYRYEVRIVRGAGESPPASCEVVAVPFLDGAWGYAIATVGGLVALVGTRRNRLLP